MEMNELPGHIAIGDAATLQDYNAVLGNDNCSNNKKTAVISRVLMIGCGSHRFNLAVEKYLEQHSSLLQVVHELMKVNFIYLEIKNIKASWKIETTNKFVCCIM